MGGKSKTDRTKNNARPSSSGRSAELLNSSTKDSPIFGTTGNPLTPIFPTLAAVNIEHGLNTEYALCFKKFNKKDPITKTKALQELLELTRQSSTEEAVAALPAWAHFYPILSSDSDRKVRECTQACQAALAARAGRQLAPQLRRLLPAWLLAACDDHGPARHLAHAALTNTFPEDKLGEAMSFCREEVFGLLRDNIANGGEGRLLNRTEDEEERKAHGRFIVASSLGALALLGAALPPARADWLWEALQPLLRARAFWAFALAADHRVRAAWYGLVGSLWARFGRRMDAECSRRAWRALLAPPPAPPLPVAPPAPAASDAPPAPAPTPASTAHVAAAADAPHRWAALLLFVSNVQDWHAWADDKDVSLFVKRIHELLRNGGWGDAARLGPLLRALLPALPAAARSATFYSDLFASALTGLEKKNVMSSKSERRAWSAALGELLRHVAEHEPELAAEVVPGAHRAWLVCALAAPDRQARVALLRCTALDFGALVAFWLRDGATDPLLDACWRNVTAAVADRLTALAAAGEGAADFERVADDHVLLLRNLKTAFNQGERKKHSIKFAEDVDIEPKVEEAPAAEYDATAAERYRRYLDETVETTCALFLGLGAAGAGGAAGGVLRPLHALLAEFESSALLGALSARLGAATVYGLYETVLRARLADAGEHRRALLDIVFLLLKHLGDGEQDRVFGSFDGMCAEAVEWCVALSVSAPHCAAPAARRWLRGVRAQCVLLALTTRAFCLPAAPTVPPTPLVPDGGAAQLLLRCLGHDPQGESITSEETMGVIVQQVCEAVRWVGMDEGVNLEPEVSERRVRTAAQLCRALAAARSAHGARLANALFALQLHVPRGEGPESPDTWAEARRAWREGLAAQQPASGASEHLPHHVRLLHARLHRRSDNLDISEIEHVADVAADIILPVEEPSGPAAELAERSSEALARLLLAPCDPAPNDFLDYCALKSDCIMGNMNCPFDDGSAHVKRLIEEGGFEFEAEAEEKQLRGHELQLWVRRGLFRALCLRALRRLPGELFLEQLLAALHHLALLTTLEHTYVYWVEHEVLSIVKGRLDLVLDDVITESSSETKQRLMAALAERAAQRGYYWAYARRRCELAFGPADPAPAHLHLHDHLDLDDFTQIITGGGFFHTLQANSRRAGDEAAAEAEVASEGEEGSEGSERLRALYLVAVRSALAALGEAGAAEQFAARAADGLQQCSLDPLLELHCTHPDILPTDRDLTRATWASAVSGAAAADLLAAAVRVRGWRLPAHHWDFVTLTLAGLVHSLHLSAAAWGRTEVALVCVATLRLFASVQRFARGVRAESERRRPEAHVLALAAEWEDVFAPALNTHLFGLILHILREAARAGAGAGVARASVSCALGRGARALQWGALPAGERAGALAAARLARAATDALAAAHHPAYVLLAYNVLRALAEPLVLADAALLAEWSAAGESVGEGAGEGAAGEGGGRARAALEGLQYGAAMRHLHKRVARGLSGLSACSSAWLHAGSDDARAAAAFLLLHAAAHEQTRLARGDLAMHYVDAFREGKFAVRLVTVSVRLLPRPLAALANEMGPPSPTVARHKRQFVDTPDPSLRDVCSDAGVRALACRGVWCALAGAGAAEARGWWCMLRTRESRAVRRLVEMCVAPPLRAMQLAEVRARGPSLRDAEVAVLSDGSARCRLELDERTLELSVQFSEAHPLVPPRVCAAAAAALLRPAAADEHWLTVYLAYQNGSLFNTFKMWLRAMNARIESTRQCCVCYYRLHPTTGRMPAAVCPQCRNKFHRVCLHKWFKTHGAPTCPLCRSEF